MTLLRGAARTGDGDATRSLEPVRATLAGMGWTPEAPTDARPDPRPLGVAAGAGRPGRGVRRPRARRRLGDFVADLDRRAAEQHAPAADGVTLATLPRRQGPGVGRRLPRAGCRTARCRSPTPTRPAAIEEERRLLYVGMTRARVDLALSWAPARTPGGRASRKPSRFLDRAAASGGARTPPSEPPAASARASRTAASAASRCRRRREEARPLRRLPRVVRRGAVRAAARVAQGARRRGERAGVRRVHRRHAAADRRASRADTEALLRINGIGRSKLDEVRRGRPRARRGSRVGPCSMLEKFEEIPRNVCRLQVAPVRFFSLARHRAPRP